MNVESTHQVVVRVIRWASEAAVETCGLARFHKEEPDAETSMGLWQSFQAAFPKDRLPGVDYDMLVTVYSHTYTSTVEAIVKADREATLEANPV